VDSINTWTTLLFQSKLADFKASAKRFPTEFHSAGDVVMSLRQLMLRFFLLLLCLCIYPSSSLWLCQWVKYNQTLGRTCRIAGCLLADMSPNKSRRQSNSIYLPAGEPRWWS